MVVKMRIMVREMGMVLLEIEGKGKEILEVHSMADLIKVQILEAQE